LISRVKATLAGFASLYPPYGGCSGGLKTSERW